MITESTIYVEQTGNQKIVVVVVFAYSPPSGLHLGGDFILMIMQALSHIYRAQDCTDTNDALQVVLGVTEAFGNDYKKWPKAAQRRVNAVYDKFIQGAEPVSFYWPDRVPYPIFPDVAHYIKKA